ncbi:ATP-binding cassette domain-containing protein [candidate division FCPU426 bacterium]|nr:ATP-binding cassette domain-containing protein [candidate division FCPU426 bacterium]
MEILKGQTFGLVGESGCGKSTLGKIMCRLEDPSCGEVYFQGEPVHSLRGNALRKKRHFFQPVFQDPFGSLNPRLHVFETLAEPLRLAGRASAIKDVLQLMELVGLGEELLFRYAHQLSGGQRQRLGIARALSVSPQLIVADEPVSSLDVSIQAQILNLFMDLQHRLGLTLVFISHDLRVINQVSDHVAVMYMGRIMESAPVSSLFSGPKHPYTWALLEALPRLKPGRGRKRAILTGELPSPINPAPGCRFYNRCAYRDEACRSYENELFTAAENHTVACRKAGTLERERPMNTC